MPDPRTEKYSDEALIEYIIAELENKPVDRETLDKIFHLLQGLED